MDDRIDWSTSRYPLVSIITVNHNSLENTLEFLQSLTNVDYPRFEVILVDNGSDNKEAYEIVRQFPDEVVVISSTRNLGYIGGCNLGVKYATGKYYFFIHNDIIVDRNFLKPIVALAERKKYTGAINPKILYHSHPEIIQYAGYTKFNLITLRNKTIGFRQKNSLKYRKNIEIDTFYNLAVLIPSWTFQHIGPMNEKFISNYADHDWAQRMKKKGYKFYLAGESEIYHKKNFITQDIEIQKEYELVKDRFTFANLTIDAAIWYPFTMIYLYYGICRRKIINYKKKGQIDRAENIRKAMKDSIPGFPLYEFFKP